eukprot:TRINITY_DN136_c0_g1_i1.p1 TRINITY_DN136_c0_g1~~TRINITY_DN136_c0_g1_i1.p1  ORF type:complete len:482 (-),score=112.85 TRINITY_DN136_c0_g1_i1:1280-2725(-)
MEQKPATQDQESEEDLKTIKLLLQEFDKIFTKQNLQNSPYYVNKMNENLEIQFSVVIHDKSIKNICKNPDLVIKALKQCNKVLVQQENQIFAPLLESEDKIIVVYNFDKALTQEIIQFIKEKFPLKDADAEVTIDTNRIKFKFKVQELSKKFFEWVFQQTYKNNKLQAFYQQEQIYNQLVQSIKQMRNEQQNMYQQQQYYPQYPQFPQYPQQPMFIQQRPYQNMYQMPQQGDYMNNLYIRRAKEEGQQQIPIQNMQPSPQMLMMMYPPMYVYPPQFFQPPPEEFEPQPNYQDRNKGYQNRGGRKFNKYYQEKKGGNDNKYNNNNKGYNKNYQPKQEKETKKVRLDSQEFPALQTTAETNKTSEKKETEKKEVEKKENQKTAQPEQPQSQVPEKDKQVQEQKPISVTYKINELYDLFENIRGSLPIPEQLQKLLNQKEKFIIKPEGLFVLEAFIKLRKNSTVPPLLHQIRNTPNRKYSNQKK